MLTIDAFVGQFVMIVMKKPYYIMTRTKEGFIPVSDGKTPCMMDIIQGVVDKSITRTGIVYSVLYDNPSKPYSKIRLTFDPEDVAVIYSEVLEKPEEVSEGNEQIEPKSQTLDMS
jgi:hypothetical protein